MNNNKEDQAKALEQLRQQQLNLCDTCACECIAECGATLIEWGCGFGNDNVISCDGYEREEVR